MHYGSQDEEEEEWRVQNYEASAIIITNQRRPFLVLNYLVLMGIVSQICT